jgi:subtilisin family serine protease
MVEHQSKLDGPLADAVEQARADIEAGERSPDEPIRVLVEADGSLPAADGDTRAGKLASLREAAAERLQPVRSGLEAAGVGPDAYSAFWVTDAVAAALTVEQVEAVADLDAVGAVRLDRAVDAACSTDPAAGADADAIHESEPGYTGRGVSVAVLDSGVDADHPALAGRVADAVDATGGRAGDPGDHGTGVAGVVAADGERRGVAPDAEVLDVRVASSREARPSWLLQGYQAAVTGGADVVAVGVGWSHVTHWWECPYGFCPLCDAADRVAELGAVVVAPVGNEARESEAEHVDTSMRCPGNARSVLAVGAHEGDDRAGFSSVGPTSYGADCPDVSAPGVDVTVPVIGGEWAAASGTSVAAAHVTGVAALLREKYAHLDTTDVKHVLRANALGGSGNTLGAGPVDAERAFGYLAPAEDEADVYIADHVHDDGSRFDGGSRSPDVWSQIEQFGREAHGVVNPHTSPEFGQTNYVYVRAHNRGTEPTNEAVVRMRTKRFSTFPKGDGRSEGIPIEGLRPSETRIVGPFTWDPPRTGHGCFLARIDVSRESGGYGWQSSHPEVAQRNIDVVDSLPNGTMERAFYVEGREGESCRADLVVDRSGFPGEVRLRVLRRYVEDGVEIEETTDLKATVRVVDDQGRFAGVPLEPGEETKTYVELAFPEDVNPGRPVGVTVEQYVDGELVGDVSFLGNCLGETPFVRNVDSGEVHRHDCTWAERIDPENKRPVRSLRALRARGFPETGLEGCYYCLPRFHSE